MSINPFTYAMPETEQETISFANACAYEWSYLDTMRLVGRTPERVPDGWAFAWLEYARRNASRMAIREAFRYWQQHSTLPGLS
ncbi:hypothetical protein FHU38_000866 [Saccharomonospora amisosensis]|uniref:Uncharacterized protein n=1 Tax=Saccharomonospora amisosensis TaxID=1128677 RepID=A0A7X5UMN3_9PSEU|nr:hypothetical protein [Saccharomonospora amisosensis]